MILVHSATEDELSESVACKIIENYVPDATVGLKLRKGGSGYLKSSLHKFCQMAEREAVLMLVDLDRVTYAPSLIDNWFGGKAMPPKLFFRVAVREIESWLLADRPGLANFFEISKASLPSRPDELLDPKQSLLHAARGAPRHIRSELLRIKGTMSTQGLGYNRVLTYFVERGWDAERARLNSPSLDRSLRRLSATFD